MRGGGRQGTVRSLTFAAVFVVLLALAPAAFAATYTVNTTADSTDTGGCTSVTVCSLRDAVTAANATAGSTIDIPAGDYVLNTSGPPNPGELAVDAPTTIIGAGARSTTLDGNGISRVFFIEDGPVTIEKLTITGGHSPATGVIGSEADPGDGGGIFSEVDLDLEQVAITGNTSDFGGAGLMEGSVETNPLLGTPTATLNGVTIDHNTVTGGLGNGQGGGAVLAATVTMTNSTIADNTVSNPGTNEGGGIVSTEGTATLTNDTIVGNVAAEPVASPAGDFGGGISGDDLGNGTPTESTLATRNTIVADNQADGAEQDCAFIDTAASISDHNISGDTSCSFSDSGSQVTTAIGLGSLQNNGGPTDTLLPAATSPAVNAGDNLVCPAFDERGVVRPQGPACDIGAVELALPTAITGPASGVTISAATLSGTAGNPAVEAGTATFQYGTSTAYGRSAAAGSVAAGASGSPEGATLSGLAPATVYHYRLLVTNSDGTAYGADKTFTTAKSATSIKIVKVTGSPTHKGCVAHVGRTGHALPKLAAATSCNKIRLTIIADITKQLDGYAYVNVSGGFPGHHFKVRVRGSTASASQPYPNGKLKATVVVAARSRPDPAKIKVAFAGDSKFAAASASTTRLLEVGSTTPAPPPNFTG